MRLLLALSVLLTAPGPQAWAAAGRSLEGRVKTGPTAAPQAQGVAPRSAIPAAAARAAASSEAAPKALIDTLAAPLPDFKAMGDVSRGAAESDFLSRMGLVSEIVVKRKEMPEDPEDTGQPRRGPDPHDPGRGDPLGNPPRSPYRDDGPDSRDQGLDFSAFRLQAAKSKDRRRVPGPDEVDDGQDRRRRDPQDPLNSDELGNPRRDPREDTGPDSREVPGAFFAGPNVFEAGRRRRAPGPDEVDDGADERPRDPQDPLNSDDLGNVPRDPRRDDGPDSRDGDFRVDPLARFTSHMSPGVRLGVVAGGAIAFAAFGAVGLPALAWASSVVAAVNAVPLVGAALSDPSHATVMLPMAAAMTAVLTGSGESASTGAVVDDNAVQYVVKLKDGSAALTADRHVSSADVSTKKGRAQYGRLLEEMYGDLAASGLAKDELDGKGAAPVATYKRIHAVTVRVSDAQRAPAVKAWLESQGHAVYDDVPAASVPAGDLQAQLQSAGAETVRAMARERFGPAEPGWLGRLALKLVGYASPSLKQAAVGGSLDAQLALAPWLRRGAAAYRAPATLDDTLKSLTAAANDGHLVITDQSGLEGLAAQLRRRLAMEGHVVAAASARKGEPGSVFFRQGEGSMEALAIPSSRSAERVEPSSVAGAIALLAMMFGVAGKGEALDAVAQAVAGRGPVRARERHVDVDAAYETLSKTLKPVVPGPLARLALKVARATDPGPRLSALPRPVIAEYVELLREHEGYLMRAADISAGRALYDDDVDPGFERADENVRARMSAIEAVHPAAAKLGTLRGYLWRKFRGL